MFKNKEIKKYIIIAFIIMICICAAAALFDIPTAAAVLMTAAFMMGLWGADMAVRYRHMRQMAEEIDMILHGRENINLSDYEEGDVSILRNEVAKLTCMLKQQAGQLKCEKTKLADSLADISHQVRTPLTSLNLMLEALKKEQDEEKRAKLFFDMRRQLERIDGLVVTLLKLAKMDAGTIKLQKAQVELNELVRLALQPLEIMLELKDITIKKDVSGAYTGDKVWSAEAIGNILKNCMEHTDNGGCISITGYENAVHTELVIEDTGCGISDEDLPHIFERFYKGRGSKSDSQCGSQCGSYGIGLALARSIILGQNGTIKAENVRDNDGKVCGARFVMRFYKSIV